MGEQFDCIHIRDLKFRCIVGINEDERIEKQDVVANIALWADLTRACRSDNIDDTVDYKSLKKKILNMAENSNFLLIEALSQAIADLCLEYDRVEQVRVCVEKPTALRFARTVGVEIVRTREK
jgi:FolB domain-containing protein